MKKFLLSTLSIIVLSGFSQSSFAGYGESSGNTICYIFKNEKLIKKLPCQYNMTVSGRSDAGGTSHSFKIKGFGNIDTNRSFETKMDGNANPLKDAKGNDIVTFTTNINDKPAQVVYRNSRDFRDLKYPTKYTPIIPKANILICIQAKNKSLELCVPSMKTDLASGG